MMWVFMSWDKPNGFVIRPDATDWWCSLAVPRWLNTSVAMPWAFQKNRLLKYAVFGPRNGHCAAGDHGVKILLDFERF